MYGTDGALRYQENGRTSKATNYIYLAGSLIATKAQTMWLDDHRVEYQHTDALGTPVAVTDVARNVIERSEYEPYGQLLNRPIKDGAGYTGHVSDAMSGLTYMQQRYYDAQTGRFLSVDPIAANATNGLSFNRFNYAVNNPYGFTDPDGRNATAVAGAEAGFFVCGPVCAVVGGLVGFGVGLWLGDKIYDHMQQNSEGESESQSSEGEAKPVSAFPDRALPRDRNGNPTPDPEAEGVAHTQLGTEKGSKGDYPQAREFNADGEEVRTIDFTDHGRADHPNPHQHPRIPNPTGGTPQRGPAEPLPKEPTK